MDRERLAAEIALFSLFAVVYWFFTNERPTFAMAFGFMLGRYMYYKWSNH